MIRIVLALAFVITAIGSAHAQVGSVSPGKLATAHAAIESQCNRCHIPFGGIPATLCLTCHTALADRTARGIGYHATVKAQPCTDCHKDHHGRDAVLSPAPPATFDHRTAAFPLDGQHKQLGCDRCHPKSGASQQWVGIATTCERCHADRAHRGTFGSDCAKCHRTDGWTPVTRTIKDHQVSMAGGHASLNCADCHKSGLHLAKQQSCAQCHAQKHGGTKLPCTTCHDVKAWNQNSFAHKFAPSKLPGKHQTVPCLSCHPAFQFTPTSFECAACHDKERPHEPLGACTKCHSALSWKISAFDHDAKSVGFALTGRHKMIECKSCHTEKGKFRAAKRVCETCHADPHGKQFAVTKLPNTTTPPTAQPAPTTATSSTTAPATTTPASARPAAKSARGCIDCHTTEGWTPSTITVAQHTQLGFPLREQHDRASCKGCHPTGSFVGTTQTCKSCHADVRHRGRLGTDCASCHDETAWWLVPKLDHARTGFALERGHAKVGCASCHDTNGMRLVGNAAPAACETCHAPKHGKQFGATCTECHTTASFTTILPFDHKARTGFALENTHAKVACTSCHGSDGARLVGKAAPTACETCHAPPHGRQFGNARCAECHTTTSFKKRLPFDHTARTDFPLERRHSTLPCLQCHDSTKRPVVNPTCRTCHGDPHRGSNGLDCSDCHRADRWRIVRFDHDQTSYPLVGRHRVAACSQCHTNPNWTGVRSDCIACHAFDRPRTQDHLTKVTCDDCHTETNWRTIHR